MIEYTYFEVFLLCAFFIVLGYAFKYHEEAKTAKLIVRAMLQDKSVYDRMKNDHDTFMKELRNAD
jgi:hypothetical protein